MIVVGYLHCKSFAVVGTTGYATDENGTVVTFPSRRRCCARDRVAVSPPADLTATAF
jgi:hypothetical protein